MENMDFNIDGLLSPEEAEKLFGESGGEAAQEETGKDAGETAMGNENGKEKEADGGAEDATDGKDVKEETEEPVADGGAGRRIVKEKEDAAPEGGGSSQDVLYSSIAKALKDDDILHIDDSEIAAVRDNEGLGELFEKEVRSRLDERQRRIDDALRAGVPQDEVRSYENTIEYLDSIDDELLSGEGEDGENLRRQIIYNDLANRGYTQERANREVEKSIKSGTDIEDARDALDGLRTFYRNAYDMAKGEAEKRKKAVEAQNRKDTETLRKMTVDSDIEVGGVKLDKAVRQRIFDATMKPVHRDADSGKLMTAIQQFQKENPLEFMRQLGMWWVLTDGGKDWGRLSSGAAKRGRHEAMKELAGKINTTSINHDGGLNLLNGMDGGGKDILLEDGWKIG